MKIQIACQCCKTVMKAEWDIDKATKNAVLFVHPCPQCLFATNMLLNDLIQSGGRLDEPMIRKHENSTGMKISFQIQSMRGETDEVA